MIDAEMYERIVTAIKKGKLKGFSLVHGASVIITKEGEGVVYKHAKNIFSCYNLDKPDTAHPTTEVLTELYELIQPEWNLNLKELK